MIYELRTYTLVPGALPGYLQVAESVGWPARGQRYGRNLGYWSSQSGLLNQIWHLWAYESYAERTRLRGELANNPAWTADYVPLVEPLIEREDLRLLNPLVDPHPPAVPGNIFEIEIYRARVGKLRPWTKAFQAALPARERHAPIVGAWTGEFPQPSEIVLLWAYPSLAARTQSLEAAGREPAWQQFLATSTPLLAEMRADLLVPTNWSPVR